VSNLSLFKQDLAFRFGTGGLSIYPSSFFPLSPPMRRGLVNFTTVFVLSQGPTLTGYLCSESGGQGVHMQLCLRSEPLFIQRASSLAAAAGCLVIWARIPQQLGFVGWTALPFWELMPSILLLLPIHRHLSFQLSFFFFLLSVCCSLCLYNFFWRA
jgi:hypothetical protein